MPLLGDVGHVWGHFLLPQLGKGCYWHLGAEVGDAAKHLMMHIRGEHWSALDTHGAEAEKPRPGVRGLFSGASGSSQGPHRKVGSALTEVPQVTADSE